MVLRLLFAFSLSFLVAGCRAGASEAERLVIPYGPAEHQFGELSLPPGDGPFEVAVLIHGGFWRAAYGLDLMVPLANDLTDRGLAAWNIEYRRVGQAGGGWPGTLEDVAVAIDHLALMAPDQDLDLDAVTVIGHSAGGHLALWSGGRQLLAPGDPGAGPVVVPAAVVGQAPVTDLAGAAGASIGAGAVVDFLGGSPETVPERYAVATPRFDPAVAHLVVHGAADVVVPPSFGAPAENAALVVVELVEGADHFDVIDPDHRAWARVVEFVVSGGHR